MCFSAEADIAAGIFVTGIGIDVGRHVAHRRNYWLLASIPLILGAHQIVEAFVWWGLGGHVAAGLGRAAMWVYLVVALVVLPILVPLAVLLIEPTTARRRRIVPFVALGTAVSLLLGWGLTRGPVTATIEPWHLAYRLHLFHGTLVTGLYIVATCGALLRSGFRHLARYGVANLVAVTILAVFTMEGFVSLWCAYAAVSAGAIAWHTRRSAMPVAARDAGGAGPPV